MIITILALTLLTTAAAEAQAELLLKPVIVYVPEIIEYQAVKSLIVGQPDAHFVRMLPKNHYVTHWLQH